MNDSIKKEKNRVDSFRCIHDGADIFFIQIGIQSYLVINQDQKDQLPPSQIEPSSQDDRMA